MVLNVLVHLLDLPAPLDELIHGLPLVEEVIPHRVAAGPLRIAHQALPRIGRPVRVVLEILSDDDGVDVWVPEAPF